MKPLWIGLLILLIPSLADAYPNYVTWKDLVNQAGLIVEGQVISQDNEHPLKVDESFLFEQVSQFKISKVYKGNLKEGEIILVYSKSTSPCDMSDLKKQSEYVLFLQSFEKGFEINNQGEGQFLILVENNKKKVQAWDGNFSLYSTFVEAIKNPQALDGLESSKATLNLYGFAPKDLSK